MSTVSREEFTAALAAFEEERRRSRRFRRLVEDLLDHLDESNMPTVAERIRALRGDLLSFRREETDTGRIREASLSPSALTVKETEGDAVCSATLTARTLCIPAVFAGATDSTDGLRPVYIREDGSLTAVLT